RGCSSRGARTRANQAGIPCRAWSSSATSGTGATCGTSLPVRRLPKAPRASPQAGSGCTRAACRRVRCRPRPADTDRAETVWGLAEPLGRGANFAGFPLQQAVHHGWVGFQEAFDLRAGEDQAAQRAHGDDVRRGRLTQAAGDLAEVVARPKRCAVDAIDADRRRAVEHHVQTRSAEALAKDLLAIAEPLLAEDVGDLLALRRREVGEQRKARDGVRQLLACHWSVRPRRP